MNEFKGTRGEWEVVAQNETGALIIGMNGNESICTVWGSVDEFEANAKLIACAPEMLKMLENVVSWYGKRDFKTNELYSSNFQEPLIKETIQLIKKATEL